MTTRRRFLQSAATAGSLLPTLALAESKKVQLRPEIEPLVRLIEQTPRERCVEEVAKQVKMGLPYRDLLAAMFLAGIRNVNPQPPGFKFHCVFVIHAAHQVSLDIPASERLLPLFWALDNFKVSQQRDVQQGDFELQPVSGKLPSAATAWREFHSAMRDWDEEKADRAIAVLARTAGAQSIAEEMWSYGARDYRNIGHKAIFVANTWQTLQTIGWQHAEPSLRSLVLGLLDFGKAKRVNSFAYQDQCFLHNLAQAKRHSGKLPATWLSRKPDAAATEQLMAAMRQGKVNDSCDLAVKMITGKSAVSAQAVWDAVHLMAGELMMRQPGIFGIHTVTSAHGLHYAFDNASRQQTRLLMMLQGVGWMSQFRHFMKTRNKGLNSARILKVSDQAEGSKASIAGILANVSKRPASAAKQAYRWAKTNPLSASLSLATKRLVGTKARDAHHFKYSTSILSDAEKVSPIYRPHMYATAAYFLCGSDLSDSSAVSRAKMAMKG